MYHLGLLGCPTLSGPSGPVTGRATQPRRLAVLTVLGTVSPEAVTRAKLAGLLWRDVTEKSARRALSDVLYDLRRALGEEAVVGTGSSLRVNPDQVWCDAAAFPRAVKEERLEEAVEIYGGPFLDGFYVDDAPSFEKWSERRRRSLAELYADALRSLAEEAARTGEPVAAARWWRKLAAHDPLNTRVALAFVEALEAAGDPAGALHHAADHRRLLRERLDLGPPPELEAVTARLRSGASTRPNAGGGAGDEGRGRGLDPARTGSVAVLPFANLSPDVTPDHFVDGVTDEVISRLTRLRELKVISRTSTMSYKDVSDLPLGRIAEELDVSAIVEGSVRQDGDRVRITAQLIDAERDEHLWTEVYERELEDVFVIQGEIAARVAEALRSALSPDETGRLGEQPTTSLGAWELYQRAEAQLEDRYTREELQEAVRLLEEAVGRDPGFTLAYVKLSWAYSHLRWFGYDTTAETRRKERAALERALELEPELPEVRVALGFHLYRTGRDYEAALRELAAAEGGLPGDPTLHVVFGCVLRRQGRFEKAVDRHLRALELDPHSPVLILEAGVSLLLAGEFEEAAGFFRKAGDRAASWMLPRVMCLQARLSAGADRGELRELTAEALEQGSPTALLTTACHFEGTPLLGVWLTLLRDIESDLSASLPDGETTDPISYFLARSALYRLREDHELEKAFSDSARILLERQLEERPNSDRLRSLLGLAYAGLGREAEAIREARRATELLPVHRDAFYGPVRRASLAQVLAMAGRREEAIEELTGLFDGPGHLNRHWARIDPTWDHLREDPGFRALVDDPAGNGYARRRSET